MKRVKIIVCMCLANSPLYAADDTQAAAADFNMVVVQTQIPAEHMTAQKAVFAGIEKLEPELVRAALAALTTRGQKVSALAVVAALEKAYALRIGSLRWATLGSASFVLYGSYYATRSFWNFYRRHGFWQGVDVAKALFGLSVGVCAFVILMIRNNVMRIIRIIDALVGANQALEFGGDFKIFARRILALQEKIGEVSSKMPILRAKLATVEAQYDAVNAAK